MREIDLIEMEMISGGGTANNESMHSSVILEMAKGAGVGFMTGGSIGAAIGGPYGAAVGAALGTGFGALGGAIYGYGSSSSPSRPLYYNMR